MLLLLVLSWYAESLAEFELEMVFLLYLEFRNEVWYELGLARSLRTKDLFRVKFPDSVSTESKVDPEDSPDCSSISLYGCATVKVGR